MPTKPSSSVSHPQTHFSHEVDYVSNLLANIVGLLTSILGGWIMCTHDRAWLESAYATSTQNQQANYYFLVDALFTICYFAFFQTLRDKKLVGRNVEMMFGLVTNTIFTVCFLTLLHYSPPTFLLDGIV